MLVVKHCHISLHLVSLFQNRSWGYERKWDSQCHNRLSPAWQLEHWAGWGAGRFATALLAGSSVGRPSSAKAMLLSQPDRGIEVQRTPSEEDGWKVRTFKKPKGRNSERRQRFKNLINGNLFCYTHTGIFQDNPWVNPFTGSSLKNKIVEKKANYNKTFLFHRVVKA